MNDPQQKRIRALIEAIRVAHPNVVVAWAARGITRCDCQNCVSVREIDARKRSNNHDPE